jgi:hypothetical protein
MIFELGLPHTLYLAVPETIFTTSFDPAVMQVVRSSQIKIAIVNLEQEVVTRWIQ